jgi:putative ABC transport system permease protein
MDLKETTATSFEALVSNKLRTGLAILGIVIGIGAVVALITLGKGAQDSVTKSISSLGSNMLTVQPGSTNDRGIQGAGGSSATLTLDDAKALSNNPAITAVGAVSAEVSRNFQVTIGRNNGNYRTIGVLPAYAQIRNNTVAQGSFITQDQVNSMAKVAVIGPSVATELFKGADPIGQVISIKQVDFRVVGVTNSKGGNGFFSEDEVVYVPITTAQKILLGTKSVQSISIEAKSADEMVTATNQVGFVLLARHHLSDPAKADFSIRSQADILGAATTATSTLTGLLSGIAAISLLVGGIGIMNVMLVTITERTREIGIRKAIGAKRKDILTQFLIEAIVLTASGGIIGIILGFALSYFAGRFIGISISISYFAPLLAFSVSSAIGLIFGYYPARRAALMQPIVALRYE